MTGAAATAGTPTPAERKAARWRLAKRIGLPLYLLVVAGLIASQARHINWGAVGAALAAYSHTTLLGAALLVAASHLTYSGYELLGRRYVGHRVPVRKTMGVGLVSYAFNLNLGALLGGAGFRLRLYGKMGLETTQIARLILFSLVTNWSGYLLLAGSLLAARVVELPPALVPGATPLQALGAAMVCAGLAYVGACAFSPRREWRLRGHVFVLPSGRMALAQAAISVVNWSLMGAVVWTLMPRGVAYPTALGTLLAAAVAAAPTSVPGGLGVLEAVFVGVLGGRIGRDPLIAALLAYRALYYLAPLLVGAALHFGLEAHERRRAARKASRTRAA